jgi:hypothetical protein
MPFGWTQLAMYGVDIYTSQTTSKRRMQWSCRPAAESVTIAEPLCKGCQRTDAHAVQFTTTTSSATCGRCRYKLSMWLHRNHPSRTRSLQPQVGMQVPKHSLHARLRNASNQARASKGYGGHSAVGYHKACHHVQTIWSTCIDKLQSSLQIL